MFPIVVPFTRSLLPTSPVMTAAALIQQIVDLSLLLVCRLLRPTYSLNEGFPVPY